MRVELPVIGDAGPGVMKTVVIPEYYQRQGHSDDTAVEFGNKLALWKPLYQVFKLTLIQCRDGSIDTLL